VPDIFRKIAGSLSGHGVVARLTRRPRERGLRGLF
jgi:hypothetical protein